VICNDGCARRYRRRTSMVGGSRFESVRGLCKIAELREIMEWD